MNGPKVFYIECSAGYWPQAARLLRQEHGWEIVCWTGTEKARPAVRELFPQALFHDTQQAIRGLPAPETAQWVFGALDQDLLTDLAAGEAIALTMMDRSDLADCFPLYERVALYHQHLRYWSGVLDRLSPDLVFFGQMPHMIYDYALYLLCQRRQIPTLFLDMSSLPGRLYPVTSVEQGCLVLEQAYRKKLERAAPGPAELSAASRAYLERLRSSYKQGMPAFMRRHFSRATSGEEAKRWRNRLANLAHPRGLVHSLGEAWNFLYAPAPPNYIKAPGRPLPQGAMTGLEWRLLRRRLARRKVRLKEDYDNLVHQPDLDRPFVFVALHYQPEKTTSPQGGVFVHQELMIDLLLEALPDRWRLLVKEAPAQFMPHVMRISPAKNQAFYQRLAARPRVSLVATETPSFQLIDKCRAVATVTGTAGWEAVVRGRPALVFGHAWYRGCEGVFYTPTRQTCAVALRQIEQGVQVDSRKVRLFVQALEEVGVWGYVEDHWGVAAGISPEENAANLAPFIHRCWTGMEKKARA